MIRRIQTLLAITLAAAAFPPAMSEAATEQPKSLAEVQEFAFGGVGAAGVPSQGEGFFRSVMEEKDALTRFRNILNNGTPAAKLYALCGIRLLAQKDFDATAAALLKSNETVTTVRGCMLTNERVGEVARQISQGAWDIPLKSPRFAPPNQK
jgi:hypothetical protein